MSFEDFKLQLSPGVPRTRDRGCTRSVAAPSWSRTSCQTRCVDPSPAEPSALFHPFVCLLSFNPRSAVLNGRRGTRRAPTPGVVAVRSGPLLSTAREHQRARRCLPRRDGSLQLASPRRRDRAGLWRRAVPNCAFQCRALVRGVARARPAGAGRRCCGSRHSATTTVGSTGPVAHRGVGSSRPWLHS